MFARESDDSLSDVIVIGGGPAGSTAATLLAQRGWRVRVFEKDTHPRFHIGESLLPMNLPIFDELGVHEAVRAIGVYKPAADFTAEGALCPRSFGFDRALGRSPPHAYQVTRSEFDEMLFRHCAAAGADAREGVEVTRIALEADGLHAVTTRDAHGEATWRCRYLIDASGQSTVLAGQERWRERDRRHSAAALFAHFTGVTPREGEAAGNIGIYWLPWGWIWMIPLRDGVTSVGAVCASEYLKNRGSDTERFLLDTLNTSPAAAARLAPATRVSPVRVAANYSYQSRRQTGAGYALVGDAYAFVDPVFSSGVYLAMSSARAIVPSVEHWLRGRRLRHAVAAWRYRRRIRRGIAAFKWFIYRFTTPAMRWLFDNPRNVLDVQRAVVSLLAGDVYDNPRVRARLVVFKLLYAATRLLQPYRHAPVAATTPEPAAQAPQCRAKPAPQTPASVPVAPRQAADRRMSS